MSFYTYNLAYSSHLPTHAHPLYAEVAVTSPLLLPVSKRADWNNCEFYLTANISGASSLRQFE